MLAQFKPEKLIKDEDKLILTFSAEDMYWKPFEEKPPTSVWKEMDHSIRKTCNHQKLTITATIRINGKNIDMNVRTEGTDRVPFKVEFIVTSGSEVTGEFFTVAGLPGQYIQPHQGMVRVKYKKDTVEIGPAFKQHTYTTNMRGSVPPSSKGFTIYFTDYTNLDRDIRINCD